MTRLPLGLSYIREHKFKHGFQNSIKPLREYGWEIESKVHFLLHCSLFTNEESILFATVHNLHGEVFENTDFHQTDILLFGK